MDKFKKYVTAFDYGNKDLFGDRGKNNGLTQAWLSSSLEISPKEQVVFLQNFLDNRLPVSLKSHQMTRKILFIENLSDGWKLYGKTGCSCLLNYDRTQKLEIQLGWFVGWIQKGSRKIVFAEYIEDEEKKDTYPSNRAKASGKEKLAALIESYRGYSSMKEFQMNIESLIDAQAEIISLLYEKIDELNQIRASKECLTVRWQQLIGLVLPIQIQVLQDYGYVGDQVGLSLFNERLMKLSERNQNLREQNKEKWSFLFDQAFGATEYKEMTFNVAQQLVRDISEAMTSHVFLEEIDRTFEDISESLSISQKRQKLLELLFPLHMFIMSKYGFDGEAGYIQAQRGLMDYYSDPMIKELATHAQRIVFERARLLN